MILKNQDKDVLVHHLYRFLWQCDEKNSAKIGSTIAIHKPHFSTRTRSRFGWNCQNCTRFNGIFTVFVMFSLWDPIISWEEHLDPALICPKTIFFCPQTAVWWYCHTQWHTAIDANTNSYVAEGMSIPAIDYWYSQFYIEYRCHCHRKKYSNRWSASPLQHGNLYLHHWQCAKACVTVAVEQIKAKEFEKFETISKFCIFP